jgi:hypothetical protein
MDEKRFSSLVGELKTVLKSREIEVLDSDTPILKYEIKRAIKQINRCRRFTPTEDKPYDEKYEDLIIPLSLSAFTKIGADGETVHSENGITRHYTSGGDYPIELLKEIVPLIK